MAEERDIITRREEETRGFGRALASVAEPGDVVLLTGDLGAGKTALAKGVAEGLGVAEPVTSPTFNILLVHEGRMPLHHFDLYRLDREEQLEDIDYFGTIEADGLSLVEWGDRFAEARPAEHVLAALEIVDDSTRRIRVEGHGVRGAALAEAWRDAALAPRGPSAAERSSADPEGDA